jgi:hypothetical protein
MAKAKEIEPTPEPIIDPTPEPKAPEPKAPEPIKIMGEPKAPEPKAQAQDIEKIVSDVFDKKLAQFIQKGPENAPTPTPEPKSYRLFDEFDIGV